MNRCVHGLPTILRRLMKANNHIDFFNDELFKLKRIIILFFFNDELMLFTVVSLFAYFTIRLRNIILTSKEGVCWQICLHLQGIY